MKDRQTCTQSHLRFWELESLGISPPKDERSISIHLKEYKESSIEFKDGRYSAKLPWKDDHPPLPDNYSVARRRTHNNIRRQQEQPSLFRKYGEIIADQDKRGFIDKVDPARKAQNVHVHYIPHRGISKDSATTPICIVNDCSCRQSRDSPSLNDCLKSTPTELKSLLDCHEFGYGMRRVHNSPHVVGMSKRCRPMSAVLVVCRHISYIVGESLRFKILATTRRPKWEELFSY